jgi:hypothetical protein
MTGALDMLPPGRQADVLTAVRALETAAGPVLAKSYRALAEPALREVVTELLAEAGRVLVSAGTGFTTGYDDRISALLAADGTGSCAPRTGPCSPSCCSCPWPSPERRARSRLTLRGQRAGPSHATGSATIRASSRGPSMRPCDACRMPISSGSAKTVSCLAHSSTG